MMDFIEESESDIQELTTERNNCLLPLLSSLNDIDSCAKLLENVKLCAKYLPTYNISNVDQELLQHVVQAVKKSILKIYDDNFLLSDTVEDELVVKILKENLQVAVGFIQVIKTILEFFGQNGEISLCYLNNTPTSLAQLISSTFEHCKNCTDFYKQTFNVELVELFRVTQEIHLLFLKLFETYVIVESESKNVEEIKTLTEVLDIICGMSETLSGLNIKSMSDNWKSYTAIAYKFSSILVQCIDLKLPILCLSCEIRKNLSSIENMDEIKPSLTTQVVKITSFLVKVVLKICDTFWNGLPRVLPQLLTFCCTVYSFPVEVFQSQGHLSETLMLMENSIFATVEPLLLRLLKDSQCCKILSEENLRGEENPFGLLNFLSNVLRVVVSNRLIISDFGVSGIINAIFSSVSLCFVEFFWESEFKNCIFDSLVLHISATVILYDEYYGEVESILLKYLLQDHIFAALLAMEIWTLLLCNSSPQLCTSTLANLLEKYQEVNFGNLTYRQERIFLKCFIQRVFKMLPNHSKNDFVLQYNPVRSMDFWKTIQFKNFPVHQRLSIEGVCMTTIEKMEVVGKGSFSFQDVVFVAENLGALSTVNFREIGLDPNNLAKAVVSLWVLNSGASDIAHNNVYKFFMPELCKITGALVSEFNSRELATVLSQIKTLSSHSSYKLPACSFLTILSNKLYENHQDSFKLHTSIAEIISQNLLTDDSCVIRQESLEVIHNFATNERHEVVRNVLRLSKEMQNDISRYLQRNVVAHKFDKENLISLGNIPFQHECLKWRDDADFPKTKKMRLDDRLVGVQETDQCKKVQVLPEKQTVKASKWCNPIGAPAISDENAQNGSVGDAIGNIRGEVKCLVKVLKTEKLTAKNASDIRMIANQLLSLL